MPADLRDSPIVLDLTLTFDSYLALFSRVYKVHAHILASRLSPPASHLRNSPPHLLYISSSLQVLLDDYDEADAATTIAEDWEGDAKGDDVLTNGEYGDALFE